MLTRVQNQFSNGLDRVVTSNKKAGGTSVLGFSDILKARTAPTTTQTNPDAGQGAAFGPFTGKAYNRSSAMQTGSTAGASYRNVTMTHARRLANLAPIIGQASRTFKVPVELICGVILQESGGNHLAKSYCGAMGLMQLMPGTARRMGVSNAWDPAQNIMGGTKYLRFLLDRFHGNVSLAVAGYNAGEGNVEKYGNRIPPFKETQAYVPNVLSYAKSIFSIIRNNSRVQVASASSEPTATTQKIVPSVIIPSHSQKV